MNDRKEKIKQAYLRQMNKGKCRKLNISNTMLDFLIERENMSEVRDILNIITKSKTKEDFKEQILTYWDKKEHPYISNFFLLGTITGNYSFYSMYSLNCENFKKENFEEKEK